MRKQVYSLLVDNTPGVLSRIAGLFSRRGFSIDSITAEVTADSRFTRITVVASGDERILSQIEKQVRKLEDVLEIMLLNDEEAVYRELILIKIRADAALRPGIIAIADGFQQDYRCGKGIADRRAYRRTVKTGGVFKSAGRL